MHNILEKQLELFEKKDVLKKELPPFAKKRKALYT